MSLAAETQTDLERVEWHVRDAEAQVARQREIVERLPPSGAVADLARLLLAEYEAALDLRRTALARLQDAG